MATLGAFFDANVLYAAGLRNFLMYLALTGTFRAHWSAEVHEEWIRNLLKHRPDITRDKLERTRRLMEQALPDAMVVGYELRDAIASSIEQSLYALALAGMDLRALDGVTVASDTRKAACDLQSLPDGAVPLEMTDQPETMELARTVAVRRGDEFRFHIALRAGMGLMTLSARPEEQALACGCIAHEAAHVEHEGHLSKTFPDVYGRTLDCGDRSRQSFIKALDVWSEYAACRSSAQFRPEATEDFDKAFCVALQESRASSQRWVDREVARRWKCDRDVPQYSANLLETRSSVQVTCSVTFTVWRYTAYRKRPARKSCSRRIHPSRN